MLSRTLRGFSDPNASRDILWWSRVHSAVSVWSWIFVTRWRRPLVSGAMNIPCAFVMMQHLVNEADNNLVRRDVGWVVPSPLLLSCSQNVARLEFYDAKPLSCNVSSGLSVRRWWGEIVAPVLSECLCSMRIDSFKFWFYYWGSKGKWWCITRRPNVFIRVWICETWFARQSDPFGCGGNGCGVRVSDLAETSDLCDVEIPLPSLSWGFNWYQGRWGLMRPQKPGGRQKS
jgi:hypothetical protein